MSARPPRTRAAWRDLVRRNHLRLRLTAIYSLLFLLSGTALLVATYVLVDRATANTTTAVSFSTVSDCTAAASTCGSASSPAGSVTVAAGRIDQQFARAVDRVHHDMLNELVLNAGLALLVTTALSIALGWVVAGRLLRPLRTITASAREITATNLHRRLDLGGARDEVTELGATIDDLLSRLEAAFEAQRQFVANASHEMRTPLTRQRTIGQVALQDPAASKETLREAHERILAAGEQQNRLIDALLDLARGQTGPQQVERFDLSEVAAAVCADRHQEAAQHGVAIRTDLQPAPVQSDPRLVQLLVTNLVDNALRYNVSGGHVEVETSVAGGRSVLRVANTGPDVDPALVPQLTQPFRRAGTDRTSTTVGTGLGLSIVAAVTEAHQGTLDIAARDDGGLVVTVSFAVAALAHH